MTRPIVFLTDYGLADEFVGVCRGVMLAIAPDARIVDLTHAVRRHDVLQGSIVLGRASAYMPRDAVHVGVVDPGVGSDRRAIAVETASGALLVGPDNGLLSGAWRSLGGAESADKSRAEGGVPQPTPRKFPKHKTLPT
ncbi:MAG: SAM-dependent chlorinase/fluorinase, partial [Actinomycetota bacterium]